MTENVKLDPRGYPLHPPTRGQIARSRAATLDICPSCGIPIVFVSPVGNLRRRRCVTLSSWLRFPSRFALPGHQHHWHDPKKGREVPTATSERTPHGVPSPVPGVSEE